MKYCPWCQSMKEESEFNKRQGDKTQGVCRACQAKYGYDYRRRTRSERTAYMRAYRQTENGQKAVARVAEKRREKARLEAANYRKKNPEKVKESRRRGRAKQNEAARRRRLTDPNWRIKVNLRRRIGHVLKGENKTAPTLKLLGCSLDDFILYLQSLWKPGMSWENYGINGWHIDHIIPCAAFDLTKDEEQRKCFHWSNMQPLWAKENLRKGHRIIEKENEETDLRLETAQGQTMRPFTPQIVTVDHDGEMTGEIRAEFLHAEKENAEVREAAAGDKLHG